MKRGNARRKINNKPAIAENIPANKNVVGWRKGWKPRDVKIEFHAWNEEPDAVKVGGNWLPPRFLDGFGAASLEFEFFDKTRADGCCASSGVDQPKRGQHRLSMVRIRGDTKGGGWPILEQVLDGLLKANLEPSGFVIICHRDAPSGDGGTSVPS
jgi:hypothetical protein